MIAWIAAWIALALAGLGAAFAQQRLTWLAAAACCAALCLRLPVLGAAAFSASAAIALLLLAPRVPVPASRPMRLAACALLLPAVCAPVRAADPALTQWLAPGLSLLVAVSAVVGVAAWALAGRGRYLLAVLIAAAPVAPAGGGWLRWSDAAAVLPHSGAAASWLARGSWAASLPTAPVALAWVWASTPTLLLCAVAWAFAVEHRPRLASQTWLTPLAGAALLGIVGVAAWLEFDLVWAARSQPWVQVVGHVHPAPLWPAAAAAWLDLSALALLLARLAVLGVLVWPGWTPTWSQEAAPLLVGPRTVAHAVSFGAGLALAALWLLSATDWHGAGWPSDPGAWALLASLAATAAALPSLWRGPSLTSGAAHLVQFAAAAVLVGGADAGWAVFGQLLPLP